MKTKIALAGLLTMALLLTSSVLASGHGRGRPDHAGPPEDAGPANRVTGGIEVEEPWADSYASVSFNAHQEKGNRPAKGMFKWELMDDGEVTRTIEVDVMYVKVEDNTGWFAGECFYDSDDGELEGQWLFVKAYDGGTPAREGDQIWWEWLDDDDEDEYPEKKVARGDDPENEKPITAGNLVVHYYD